MPDIPPDLVSRELAGRILDLLPKFVSYVIRFLVLALYWQAHHRVFRPINTYDGALFSG